MATGLGSGYQPVWWAGCLHAADAPADHDWAGHLHACPTCQPTTVDRRCLGIDWRNFHTKARPAAATRSCRTCGDSDTRPYLTGPFCDDHSPDAAERQRVAELAAAESTERADNNEDGWF